ncbi:class I SAM-dependent methyltransferase [Anaerosporobacter sp.]|uniref:class I SAM-dependent methyltransferase n=1 Tax=Anaerosporobacter sp. TaxID=1872529 RepID=UPI00286F611B|nr:class I SAM-dependent methyltransferase [Anaerosporobacter sp.]
MLDSIDYYNRFAAKYYEETVNATMKEQLNQFIELLPIGGAVLDLGCGSGRDSLFFIEEGFDVTSLDGAEKMCELAQIHIGQGVLNLTYEQLDFDEVFDGVWACASLVHEKPEQLSTILQKVIDCLKPNGVMYMSFRYGDFLGFNSEIDYYAYTEDTLSSIIDKCRENQNIEIIKTFITKDEREEFLDNKWLNIYIRKL